MQIHILDSGLAFNEYLEKVNKGIAIICKLQSAMPKVSLTVYKSLVYRDLDYGYGIYGKAYDNFFHMKLELHKYGAA